MSAGVKPGYKQTEIGVIPCDWSLETCAKISDMITVGIVIRPTQYYVSSGVPAFRSANVKVSGLTTNDLVFISYESNKQLSKSQVRTGDVLTVRTGYPGTSAVVREEHSGGNCIDILITRPSKRIVPDYLNYWINSSFGKDQVLKNQGGLAQQHFNVGDMRSLIVALPEQNEQKQIANALSDIDTLISSLDQLIAKKRDIHQATMQQLLNGQRRLPGFSGGWEEASLGEISFISKGEQLSQSGDTAGLVPHFNGGVSASSYTDTANTPEDTIAISEGGNSCGFVQFITTPFWCGGHCYAVRPRGIENLFLYFALKGKQDRIMGLRVGSGLPNIQKSALNSFQIALPSCRDEQTAIATILADMDSELAALEARRDKAHQLKQGMMQELLTGRIRLTNQGA